METNIINKVLIIDNELKEALPVIQAMAQKGVYSIYWDGKQINKPKEPLKGVRLVILDMRFSSTNDSRSITSHLFTLLGDSVSKDNGPFILCMWSKHNSEFLIDFKEELSKQVDVPRPYLIIDLDKNEFMEIEKRNSEDYNEFMENLGFLDEDSRTKVLQSLEDYIEKEEYEVNLKYNAIENLLCKLEKELNNINSLITLITWENMAINSATSLMNAISNLSESSGDWDNNIKTLIQYLAKANGGESMGEEISASEYILNALSSINHMFPDELWSQLNKLQIVEEDFKFIKEPTISYNYKGAIYTLSYTSKKKFDLKKDNSHYSTFKNEEEIHNLEDEDKIHICTTLYNKFKDFTGYSNFKLLCESNRTYDTKKPGNVYKSKGDQLDNLLLEEISNHILKTHKGEIQFTLNSKLESSEKKNEFLKPESISLVKLDISSSCDYAQSKLKRVRVLLGVMVDSSYFSKIEESKDIYCTPEIKINDKNVKFVFNFHYLLHESQADLDKYDKLLSFRDIFLNEIKHDLSNYISRVGIIRL